METAALDDVSLEVKPGEFLAIMGPSGCGKSTLLNILGLIDSPTSGSYWFRGEDIARCSEEELTLHRRAGVGFVFQSFNLIDDLNVAENVEVALIYLRVPSAERRQRVARRSSASISRTEPATCRSSSPAANSSGLPSPARLSPIPKLILADEPTGNLDSANGEAVMEMLARIVNGGTTIVMVTHSEEHAKRAHRVVNMLDGRLVNGAEG